MPKLKKATISVISAGDGGRDEGHRVDSDGFARLRAVLGKSQRELAEILGLSSKAVESYEQGWRKVPGHVERLLYFLLIKLNDGNAEAEDPCWIAKDCPEDLRSKCIAYVAKEGHFCWFFTGRLCATAEGGCYACKVFTKMQSKVEGGKSRCQ